MAGAQRTLLLVRHAETDWNREGRFQGHSDTLLSTVGRAQATALGRRLQALEAEQHLFDARRTAVISSDLARARETAELAFGVDGRTIHLDPRLRELAFGVFEGMTRDEIDARYVGQMAAWHHGDLDVSIGGGESRRQGLTRALSAVSAFLDRVPNEVVVVVTHGAILRQLLSQCFDGDGPPWSLSYKNTASHRVHIDGPFWVYDREV